jgi:hypothetical protein
VNVIVPFSKPEMAKRTADNLRRQRRAPNGIIIAMNGLAYGARPPELAALGPVFLDVEPAHQSTAKNAALCRVREQGGGWVAVFDCDDYYGPNYLAEADSGKRRGWIVGKRDHYVYDSRGLFRINRGEHDSGGRAMIGGSHVFHTADVGEYDEKGRYGEDYRFCASAVENFGTKLWALSPYHFCYMRDMVGGHAYPVNYRFHLSRQKVGLENCGSFFDESQINNERN